VSVSHARGEELAVVAHGRALEVPLGEPRAAFQDYLREVYGPGWDDWGYQEAPYFRVEPAKLFASFLPSAG
jgi:hypothetical protein